MAKSGSFETSKFKGDYGDRYLKFSWELVSQDIAKNQSKIKWTLKGAGGQDGYYYKAHFKVVINGSTVYSTTADQRIELYNNTTVASGNLTITHTTDGTKKFTASAEAAIYSKSMNCDGSGSWELDAIPRYGTVAHSLKSKTETTAVMNWSSDSTVDYLWYSKDNGASWTGVDVADGKSGTYTITGLTVNSTHKVKTRIRCKDSQLTTDSSALSVTTYNYPHCTVAPDFTIGNAVTLQFYNPLNRSFDFTITGNGATIHTWTGQSGTSYTGVNSAETVSTLYNSIKSTPMAPYNVAVKYGTSSIDTGGGWYSVNSATCSPAFNTFTYRDANESVTSVTGNNQVLVKGLSQLEVGIAATNKMVAKNSATPDRYSIVADTLAITEPYSTSDIAKVVGTVSSAGTKRITVTAYDSRGLSATKYKDVTVVDYAKPTLSVTLKRLNNFEAQTTLTINGQFAPVKVGGVAKNGVQSLKYRYKESGGTWPTTYTTLTPTVSGEKFSCTVATPDLDNAKAFDFEVVAADKFGTTTATAKVDVGKPIFMVSSNKKLCYMNGKEMALREDVPTLVRFTNIADSTDLNTIRTIGTYKSQAQAHTDTMENVPSGIIGGFKMIVSNWTGGEGYTAMLRQDVYFRDKHYVRYVQNDGTTWSAWKQVGLLENIYPVGAVYITSTNTNPATTLGVGTWTLIDKGFASKNCKTGSPNEIYFAPAENVVDAGTVFTRGGNSIRIRQGIKPELAMEDVNHMELGTFYWENIGVTNAVDSIVDGVAYADGANSGIVYRVAWDTGAVTQVDTFDLATVPSDATFYLDFTIVVDYTHMIDTYCDKFYWKRTS